MSVSLAKFVRTYPTAVTIYAVLALHSLLFQAVIRLEQCSSWGDCSLSLAKDALWSVVWPIYWLAYWK